ncbi:MAG: DsrE family protein [Methanoregulaceae archaeon]|jgi:tRNA 2-thiouridine synthesizing protein C|nr:DsrE family protein [Methanoregulaceae archaeon]
MMASTFLFCEMLSPERVRWCTECITSGVRLHPENQGTIKVFLTGDALFSLVDAQNRDSWNALSALPSLCIIADGDELKLQGMLDSVATGFPGVTITGSGGRDPFWQSLVLTLAKEWNGTRKAAFLLCHSPYMSRIPVYMLRFLSNTHSAGLHPELYTYLDGVHNVHNGQRPSEFENIGRNVSAIAGAAEQSGRDPWFAACSRCATARGYYQMNPGTGFCEPSSCIEDITIRPLKEILSRFSGNHPILSHMCGGIVAGAGIRESTALPRLVIFITNPPYGTEWTFGGLSLALAAAMDGMPTTVIFIEQGVYALCGTHEIPQNDKVFNVQEMIAATTDVPALGYLVHAPSLEERGIAVSEQFSKIKKVRNPEISGILWGNDPVNAFSATRMIFF